MSTFRRVVTGHAPDGKSVVASDTVVTSIDVPGMTGTSLTRLWGCDAPYRYPDNGTEAASPTWFPPLGGVRFVEFTLPPDDTPGDTSLTPAAIRDAADRLFPGLIGHFDDSNPGMHRSATTDVFYVLEGRCVLELDDGSRNALAAGDVIVQSGTMHRWKNPSNAPCRLVGILFGAHMNI